MRDEASFMRDEIKKLNKLVDEISSLFMRRGSCEIDIKIKRDKDQSIIKIIDYNTTYTPDEIDELNYILNIQRQCEIESFCWELMGDDSKEDELFLVGSMVDAAVVDKIENELHITMYRKFLCKSKG